MESFITSLTVVGLAEIGDRTQLLSLLLASRYKKPATIIAAIFLASLLNHAIAGELGAVIGKYLSPDILRYILGISFIATAVWMLKPDKLESEDVKIKKSYGAFAASFVAFFLAEIGDKTQIATIQLAAKFPDLLAVISGTTLGMMAANVPVVLMGNGLAKKLPIRLIHIIAAIIFATLGVLALFNIV